MSGWWVENRGPEVEIRGLMADEGAVLVVEGVGVGLGLTASRMNPAKHHPL